jgi:general nucleoside transport system ATP-binding protein
MTSDRPGEAVPLPRPVAPALAAAHPGPAARPLSADPPPRLALRGICKRYGKVIANDDVSLSVAAGEIHGLIGENGAGKSTLMKIAYGAVVPDAGQVFWNGEPVVVSSPATARRLGIGMVFQHFSLFDTLTVAQNVALVLPQRAQRADLAARILAIGKRYGLALDPHRHVHSLSVGERQQVEIIRALLQEPQLLIMDEPTSVLTPKAVDQLFGTLRRLAGEGISILYISHKLQEIRALCDRATVMRAGKVTGVCVPRAETVASLSRMMIGAEPPAARPVQHRPGTVALRVRHLSLPPLDPAGKALHDISLEVRRGEMIGIAGISGNGQNELLAALSGEDPRAPASAIMLFDRPMGEAGVVARRAAGLAFVPEERLGRGAVPGLGLEMNLLLTWDAPELFRFGLIRKDVLAQRARSIIERYQVKAAGPSAAAASLSGGNLQKYIVGRELEKRPAVLVIAQPTWGVDVGAAAQIRQALVDLRDAGSAVLVVSEELDELFEICDALHVIAGGRLSGRMPVAEATVELIGEQMS